MEFSSTETQEYTIQIIDMYGKLVLERTIVATAELSKEQLNVQTLANGVYFMDTR
ncbi:MAG: T9SS type A sorting domain-containing protein [Bacteroidetes bacterium]|nr:T9SS type A sorting domain-containing protein [Bacteroidota bacterium]